jgi:hypothetical protein
MTELDVADLVLVAARALGIGTGVALARLDVAAAQEALAEARQAAAAAPGSRPPGDAAARILPDRAAAAAAAAGLMDALLRHDPFRGHSGQVAVAAGLQLLAVNGWRADLDPPGAAAVIEGLASGQLSAAYAAAWLSPRLSPRPASAAMEASMRTSLSGFWSRAMDILRAPVAAVIPKHVVGVHTRATGFIPLTGHARDSVGLAWRLGGNHLDTEHILLGLLGSEGTAARALERLQISPEVVRRQVGRVTGQGHEQTVAQGAATVPSATPAARQVLGRWALGEALGRGHRYIDTDDLLLALFRESDGTAAQALARLGAGESQVRNAVTAVLAESRA